MRIKRSNVSEKDWEVVLGWKVRGGFCEEVMFVFYFE